jgi:hypothetical protein
MAGIVSSEADQKALESVGKVFLYLAGLTAVAAFIGTYIASLPIGESALIAVVAGLLFVVAFLWVSRTHIINTALTVSRTEAGAQQKIKEQRTEIARLSPFEGELSKSQAEAARLDASLKAQTELANRLRSENEACAQRLRTLEAQSVTANNRIRQLESELLGERESTERAPYMPEIDLTIQTTGFGILAAKSVQATVRNIGRGNATNVHTFRKFGTGASSSSDTPIDFVTALVPNQSRTLALGTIEDFQWVEVRVEYGSQFGVRPPVSIRYELPLPQVPA